MCCPMVLSVALQLAGPRTVPARPESAARAARAADLTAVRWASPHSALCERHLTVHTGSERSMARPADGTAPVRLLDSETRRLGDSTIRRYGASRTSLIRNMLLRHMDILKLLMGFVRQLCSYTGITTTEHRGLLRNKMRLYVPKCSKRSQASN